MTDPTLDERATKLPLTLDDLEEVAATCVRPAVWAYIQGGAGDERTLEWNREAFRRWVLVPRAMQGVEEIDLTTRLLGVRASTPFFVAPMAYLGEVHPEGEPGVASAAARVGVLAAFGTLSSSSLETIAATKPEGPRWFQLYLQSDSAVNRSLVQRAESSGYTAIIVTVDAPVLGVRDRQARAGFAIDASVPIGNGADIRPPARAPEGSGPRYRLPPVAGVTWEILRELRGFTRLPLVVKGVLSGGDARKAVDAGASAVIVSNHGGRQVDGAPATLAALPEVVAEIGSTAEVYVDGGARRGADVLLALALGARAVGIGRPVLWALAAGGGVGVEWYFRQLAVEIATSMALCGRRSISEIDRSLCDVQKV